MNSIYYVLHYVDSPCKWTDTQREGEGEKGRGRERDGESRLSTQPKTDTDDTNDLGSGLAA